MDFTNIKDNDIIYIEKDLYFNETLCINASFIKIDGQNHIFNFSKLPYGNNGIEIIGNNIEISNIEIIGAGYKGIILYGSNSILDNIISHHNCNTGIQIKFGSNNIIKNCKAYYNADYEFISKAGLHKYGFNADGFSDKQYEGEGNIYINCESYMNSDDGFDFYDHINHGKCNILKDCISHDNGIIEYDMHIHPRYIADIEWFLNFTENEITHYKFCGNGCGFKLGGNYSFNNILLINCNSFKNKSRDYSQNSNCGNIELIDCKAHNDECGFNFVWICNSIILQNCIDNSKKSRFLKLNTLKIKNCKIKYKKMICLKNNIG